jgi:hypothetical protein
VSDLADDILARVQTQQPGPSTWFTRLAPEVQEELEALRQRWLSGQLAMQRRPLARAIVETCRERRIPVSGIQGVEDWLAGSKR